MMQWISLYYRRRHVHTASDIVRVLGSGNHNCPGCGSVFRLEKSNGPGWADTSRLLNRLRWIEDAPSGSPQIHVADIRNTSSEAQGTLKKIANVFVRQQDWANRPYTVMEEERIKRRSELKEGEANGILQKYLNFISKSKTGNAEGKQKIVVPDRIKDPIMEEMAGEETLMGEEGEFDLLAEELEAVSKMDILDESRKDKTTPLICQRCHDLEIQKYPSNENESIKDGFHLPAKDAQILRERMNSRSIVVLVVDVTDLPGSIPRNLFELLQQYRMEGEDFPSIYLLGNKKDLLPKHALNDMESYMKGLVKSILPSTISIVGSKLVSAKQDVGFGEFTDEIIRMAIQRDSHIFLVGRTNVGKSQVYNTFLGKRNIIKKSTVSALHGTTVGLVRVQLRSIPLYKMNVIPPRNLYLIDLPGIIDTSLSISTYLTPRELKKVIIKDRLLKHIKGTLSPGESGLLAGLFLIECEGADPSVSVRLKLHVRPDLSYFRIPTTTLDTFIKEKVLDAKIHLQPLIINDSERLINDLQVACRVEVKGDSGAEVSFSDGIGWFSAHLKNPDEKVTLIISSLNGKGALPRPPFKIHSIE